MEFSDWKILPHAGGLLDQDEMLFEDLKTLKWLKAALKELMKNASGGDNSTARRNSN